MHRFFTAQEPVIGQPVVLAGAEAHHALHVLRLRPGDHVQLLNGAGLISEGEIKSLAKRFVQVFVVRQERMGAPAGHITLGQALPKGKGMDAIVQKATELGVRRMVPLLTERTEVHLETNEQRAAKLDKWQAVAIESIKQCGSAWRPEISVPVVLNDFLASLPRFDLMLVGCLDSSGGHLRQYWDAFRQQHRRIPQEILLLIGPEGDFTPAELDRMKSLGFHAISFGSLVLRCETAAIYGISIINHELGFAGSGDGAHPR